MTDSPQNSYAKNLQQPFGYPLRVPEPELGLPSSYEENGLHIGDVGYVEDHGTFHVLFNICFPLDHELHSCKNLVGLVGLTKFSPSEVPALPNGFSPGRVLGHGIQGSHGDNVKQSQSVGCRFVSSSTSGAILILPLGAALQKLNSHKEEEFRKLAEKFALQWCQFADRGSLYLITGFYKTSSWSLASFHSVRPTEQILERDDAGRYIWDSSCDFRQSPSENCNENQTVLISGFNIKVRRSDQPPIIQKLAPPCKRDPWFGLTLLVDFLGFFWCWLISKGVFGVQGRGRPPSMEGGTSIDHVPALSQPFHPSDVINRYLLEKNPDIQVAITHDNQWLAIVEKNELAPGAMVEEECFREYLEKNYMAECSSGSAVYLRRKTPSSSELCKLAQSPRGFSFPFPSGDTRQIVITHMRAENVLTGLKRMPVGFYVLVQFKDTRKRSKIKPVLLVDRIIEWEVEITLPTDSTVRFSVNATFEFTPTLANGETLFDSEINVRDLITSGTTSLLFSSEGRKDVPLCPSLLVTAEERWLDSFVLGNQSNTNSACDDSSCIKAGEATNQGHNALLRYHKEYGIGELKESIERFKHALDLCSSCHRCRTAALSNLATAKFTSCQVHGDVSDLNKVIDIYRDVLALRPVPLPDRTGTLLQLSQALSYQYGRVEGGTSDAGEIEGLIAEVKEISCEGSYEHRAADLILQTLKCHRAMASGGLPEVEELIPELERSAQMPPDWHFDRRYRLINLGTALRKRFEMTAKLAHLEESISVMEEAAQLIPDGHFDRPWVLACLSDACRIRFSRSGGVANLDCSISMVEDAMKHTPDGHFERPWMLSTRGAALLVRFISRNVSRLDGWTPTSAFDCPGKHIATGDLSDLEQAILVQSEAIRLLLDGSPRRPGCLANLAGSFLVRFWCLGNANDLVEAISRYRDAAELALNNHLDKVDYLNNLALSLRSRFECFGERSDLEEAISRYKDAIELPIEDHPSKPDCLCNLGNCLVTRFEEFGDESDLEEAISRHEDAIHLTPDGHPDKPNYLINLSLSYRARFQSFGKPSNLEKAISLHEDAVCLTPEAHPEKPGHLNNLALTFRARFQLFGQLADLEKAISRHKDAIRLTPDGHPHKPRYLNDLSVSLKTRLDRFGKMNDLEEAISKHADAVELTPDGHPGTPSHPDNLALAAGTKQSSSAARTSQNKQAAAPQH